MLLRAAERRLGLAEALTDCNWDRQSPARAVHTFPTMPWFHMFVIACAYKDADDCDAMCGGPLFKLAVGPLLEAG